VDNGSPEAAEPARAEVDESTYATLLEEAFIAERGTPFLLSAKDWVLIRSWRERGVPVDTAIRAVKETFDRRRARSQTGKISSIAYCANAVEERWEMERRGLVGRGDGMRDVAPEGVEPRLARLVDALSAAADLPVTGIDAGAYRKAIDGAIEKMRAMDSNLGYDELEDALSSLESSLAKKLLKALDEQATSALERRVDEALGDPSGVSPEVRTRTRRALARREVRRLYSLPPLTLFQV
jgi:hypothetical protein